MKRTREKLREAGLKLFKAGGYERTSIADIEKEAGLAPRAGGFYRHFESKAELAVEIGETSIIETRADLGFDGVLPLGDTRAELLLIAKGYRKAFERQAPLAGLIAEIGHLKEIRELENRVNRDLLDALLRWITGKPHARRLSARRKVALILSIFGGWIFYLTKREVPALPVRLTDKVMLDEWSGLWAGVLESKPGEVRSSRGRRRSGRS